MSKSDKGSQGPQGIGGGTMVIAGVGCLFVSYVFNFMGLHTAVQNALQGANTTAHAHNSQVVPVVVAALPYVFFGLVFTFLYIFANAIGLFRRPKKKAKKKSSGGGSAAAAPKPPAVLVRPKRVSVKDESIVVISPGRG